MVYKNDIKMTADKRFETGDECGQSGQSDVLKTRRPFLRKPKNGSITNNSKELAGIFWLFKNRFLIKCMFFDGVFLSVYSHIIKKLELSKLCRQKSYGALKIQKNDLFQAS
jgi:hypothetical protein